MRARCWVIQLELNKDTTRFNGARFCITTHCRHARAAVGTERTPARSENDGPRMVGRMCAALALGTGAAAQPPTQGKRPQRRAFDLTTPRPIPARYSVWIDELTCMEVRDAMAAGRTTAIIAAGGTEQNGPYVPTLKRIHVLHATAEAIARILGMALVEPTSPFEPHRTSATPGTLQLRPRPTKR